MLPITSHKKKVTFPGLPDLESKPKLKSKGANASEMIEKLEQRRSQQARNNALTPEEIIDYLQTCIKKKYPREESSQIIDNFHELLFEAIEEDLNLNIFKDFTDILRHAITSKPFYKSS